MSDRQPASTSIASRYLLNEKLGVGTTGTTWLAHDRIRDQEITIKILHPDLVQECGGLSGLAKVLRHTASFRHPSVVSIFDFAKANGSIYLSMEHLRGETLRHRLLAINAGSAPPFNLSAIAEIITTITEILEEGCKLGLPHGGIKPENIFLSKAQQIRLSEYGINNLTSTEALASSATLLQAGRYLAPELFYRHNSLSAATDQFALGVLWQELLEALPGNNRSADFRRQRSLAARLTQPEAENRFPTINELARELSSLRPPIRANRNSRSPQSRSSASLLTKTTIFIIAMVFAYFLGSSLDSANKVNLSLLSAQSEMKQRIRKLDQRRMQSLAKALTQPELQEAFLEHFRTADTFEAIESFYEEESKSGSKGNHEEFHDLIGSLEHKISAGEKFLSLFDQLDHWWLQFSDKEVESLPVTQDWKQSLASTHRASLELLAQGRFQRANTIMAETLQVLDQAYRDEQERLLSDLESSRRKWQEALAERNMPYAEPNQNLANDLDFLLTKTPQSLHTLTRIAHISERYQQWEADWRSMPPPKPDQFLNSLGMVFQSVDQLQVSIFETRIIDFYHFVEATGFDENRNWRDEAAPLSPSHPAGSISRYGATRFCDWLTTREHTLGVIPPDKSYRLPTDQEWSRLAGLVDEEGHWPRERHLNRLPLYPWTTSPLQYSNAGNYYTPSSDNEANNFQGLQDQYHQSAPVGMFPPSKRGLYDLGGNVMEWVSTPFTPLPEKTTDRHYTLRGAGWRTINPEQMQTGFRVKVPGAQSESGFRCVLASIETSHP